MVSSFAILIMCGALVSVAVAGLWGTYAQQRNLRFFFSQENKALAEAEGKYALQHLSDAARELIEDARVIRSRLEGVVCTLNRHVLNEAPAFQEIARINRDLELFLSAVSSLGGGFKRRGENGIQDRIRKLRGTMDQGDWGFDPGGQHRDSFRRRVESALDALWDIEKLLFEVSDPYRGR